MKPLFAFLPRHRRLAPAAAGLAFALGVADPFALSPATAWTFADVTVPAGLGYQHGYATGVGTDAQGIAGGAAVGDYDNDGWIDIYAVRGDLGPNLLFRNLGDGTFDEVGAAAGVDVTGAKGSGPTFGDYDSDGWLDLFIGGIENTAPRLFRNLGDGTFTDVTASAGLTITIDTFSAAFGDYNNDQHLDLLTTHWDEHWSEANHLWRNDGDGTFSPVDLAVGLDWWGDRPDSLLFTFTGNFADLDSDGWMDLVFASDFNTSQIYMNDGDGTFTNATTAVISDENGMGGTVADYDADGDLDWFVSAIHDPGGGPWGTTGNRLYRNAGDGTFEDVTDFAGVRAGFWGWGASFADFDNDAWLDLFHVNGYYHGEFNTDPARMFASNGDGTFTENSAALAIDHTGQSRGVSCFDFDRDGDLDIFITNNGQKPVLYRNDQDTGNHWLTVLLRDAAPNREAVGARVHARVGSLTQMREIRAGCNWVSQDPAMAHFGLGAATTVDELTVEWPDETVSTLLDVAGDQRLTYDRTATGAPEVALPASNLVLLGAFPNPFTGGTAIRFRTASRDVARLSIFDAAGRSVLVTGPVAYEAGEHVLVWEGRGASGGAMAPGIYFYEMRGVSSKASGKVTLLR